MSLEIQLLVMFMSCVAWLVLGVPIQDIVLIARRVQAKRGGCSPLLVVELGVFQARVSRGPIGEMAVHINSAHSLS
jgi:hypothetical protein